MGFPNSTLYPIHLMWHTNDKFIYQRHGSTYLLKIFHCLRTSPLSINFLVLRWQSLKWGPQPTFLPTHTWSSSQTSPIAQSFNWTNPTLLCLISLLTLFLQSGMSILTISNATNAPHLPRSPATPSDHSGHIVPFLRIQLGLGLTKYLDMVLWFFSISAYFSHRVDRTVLRKGRRNKWMEYFSKIPSQLNQLQTFNELLLNTSWPSQGEKPSSDN